MTYGLKVRNPKGELTLDSADLVSRVRFFKIALSGQSDSVTLPDIAGKTVHANSFVIGASGGLPHEVSVSGTVFSWTARSASGWSSGDSLVMLIVTD